MTQTQIKICGLSNEAAIDAAQVKLDQSATAAEPERAAEAQPHTPTTPGGTTTPAGPLP